MPVEVMKLIVGKYRYQVNALRENDRIYFQFPYNPALMAEIKAMKGASYHGYDAENGKEDQARWLVANLGSAKVWSIPVEPRNIFQLQYLQGQNPYERYDAPIVPFTAARGEMRSHQVTATAFELTRHYCIDAGEMGVGKTLSVIETILMLTRLSPLAPGSILLFEPAQLRHARRVPR